MEQWDVVSIKNYRKRDNRYLVQWDGDWADTWEPEENLIPSSQGAIEDFWRRNPHRRPRNAVPGRQDDGGVGPIQNGGARGGGVRRGGVRRGSRGGAAHDARQDVEDENPDDDHGANAGARDELPAVRQTGGRIPRARGDARDGARRGGTAQGRGTARGRDTTRGGGTTRGGRDTAQGRRAGRGGSGGRAARGNDAPHAGAQGRGGRGDGEQRRPNYRDNEDELDVPQPANDVPERALPNLAGVTGITGVTRTAEEGFCYVVTVEGQEVEKLVRSVDMRREHPQRLIDFFENNCRITNQLVPEEIRLINANRPQANPAEQ